MSTAYLTKPNEFSHKFLLKGQYQPTLEDIMLFPQRFEAIKASTFESMLLFNTINFKVVGENIPLAVLATEIGTKGIEELIDQEALRFTHWTPMILHFVGNIPGVYPLASGRHRSKAHNDPEESISLGLNALAQKLNKKERKTLIRKVRDLYEYAEDNIEHKSKDYVLSAFDSNKLSKLGLDKEIHDIYQLPSHLKEKLSKCAEELLEYKHITNAKLTSTDSIGSHILLNECINKIIKINHPEAFSKIIEIENFPDLRKVYSNISAPLRQAVKIRSNKNTRKFRSWLDETVENNELSEISKAYIDAVANKKGFFDSHAGKLTKTTVMALAGAGVGAITGPVGLAVGGTIGALVAPAADIGFDLVDEYVLSGLLKGWSPRMFIEELRKLNIKIEPSI
ncbi:hypothetical protein [uncultured Pseudomonas sp.]|uniref:hypothetical protein n=1 Tax=uncultured Pseudomonas sp. TaxID=114707 RepID=UPI0030DA3519